MQKINFPFRECSFASGILFFLLLPLFSAFCKQHEAELVLEANKLYTQGDFAQAKKLYSKAVAAGANNGHVFYNLGNTFYRLGEIGHAISNYRKALLQLPRNPDILANLSLARKNTIDKLESKNSFFTLPNYLNPYEAELLTFLSFMAFFLFLLVGSFFQIRAIRFAQLSFGVLFLLLALYTFGTRQERLGQKTLAFTKETRAIHPGVVTAKEIKIHSGNSEEFQVIFLLHEGAEIEVGEQRGEWRKIHLPGGRRGWAQKNGLDIIEGERNEQ